MATVHVDVELDDFSDAEILAEIKARKLHAPGAPGDGDAELRENTIERAYLAAKGIEGLPREIADLFWLVHNRAL